MPSPICSSATPFLEENLPVTWPRDSGQVPIYYAHNTTQGPESQGKRYWDEESTPLYPFGYGLSYTTFTFSNLHVSQPQFRIGQTAEVTADVENTGPSTADEVPQIYIHQQYGSTSRPVRELKDSSASPSPRMRKDRPLQPREQRTELLECGKEGVG